MFRKHIFIVKLRQGSGKDSQGLANKWPLMAPKRPQNFNPCLELTLKLVATHPPASLILLN